jgi:hypothetical protein
MAAGVKGELNGEKKDKQWQRGWRQAEWVKNRRREMRE